MSELESAFEKLTGRQPTDADVQRLYRVKDALRLESNDAVWLMFIAMNHFQSLYEDIPQQIETRTQRLLDEVERRARDMMAVEASKAQRTLTKQVAASANNMAGHMAWRARWQAAAFAAGIILVLLLATAWYVNSTLRETWFHSGYYAREKSLNNIMDFHGEQWARSPEGRLARVFSEKGVSAALLKRWSESGEEALDNVAIVSRADAEWLVSQVGQRARIWSQDGTIRWFEWLRRLLDSGALSVDETPGTMQCDGVAVSGYRWRVVHDPSGYVEFCDVWHGRVFFRMTHN